MYFGETPSNIVKPSTISEPLPIVISSDEVKKLSGKIMVQTSLNSCVLPGAGSTNACLLAKVP